VLRVATLETARVSLPQQRQRLAVVVGHA
jgi:hypothetical protein